MLSAFVSSLGFSATSTSLDVTTTLEHLDFDRYLAHHGKVRLRAPLSLTFSRPP